MSVSESEVHMSRASRVVPLLLLVAVVAVLFVGCGGGGVDGAKVESSLRQYLSTLDPFSSSFPTGSGPPRVKENSCRKMPKPQAPLVRQEKGTKAHAPIVRPPKLTKAQARFVRLLERSSGWSCVVTFRGTYSLPVVVLVNPTGEVLDAQPAPRGSPRPPVLPPATTYEGGPKQPKP